MTTRVSAALVLAFRSAVRPRLMKWTREASMIAIALAAPAMAQSPAELYTLNCWGCHLPHAEGIPGTVPRLAHSMGSFVHLPEGRAYLARVPGVANSPLNDQQIADVLNWMLETFSKDELPENFRPYTADEIRKYRPRPIVEVKDARRALVKKLDTMGYKVADFGP